MTDQQLQTKGLVMHSEARYYDLLAWALTLGRERAFRERLIQIAELQPGESALDIGCGTGTLAIAAKASVGSSGSVVGIDASPEMLVRANRKAAKAGVDVRFQPAIVEALPFPDASFDVVFSTLMLHHLPRPVREQCTREVRRVLKPGGRFLAVDFATPARERKGLFARLHRHGHMPLRDLTDLMSDSGLHVKELGKAGVSDLYYVLSRTPSPNESASSLPAAPVSRSFGRLPAPRWAWALLAVPVVAVHSLVIRGVSSHLALSVFAMIGAVAFIVLIHSG
ncbi:MAG TPA: class I SAM-dependent methyltransferase, partial [Gemmatimonadaceae bacterium]|nr:class I SAM-dependent methyltransferase [Gemmatimonadaceae bacterium]